MAASPGLTVSHSIGGRTSVASPLMRVGFTTQPANVSCDSAPTFLPRSHPSLQFSVPTARWCSASDSFATHSGLRNSFVRDGAVSVSCWRSGSYGGRQRRLLGLKNRCRDSFALPAFRGSLESPSEPGNEQTEAGSRDDNNLESSGSGLAGGKSGTKSPPVANELNKAVTKTAATFAPRPSTASKNPAPPGSTLYTVFEAQAYVAMALGGALSFNLLFPSDHPDIWRLMGMWSVWMFTVPSLRARDCSKKEKEALNYLFLVIPLVNVTLPLLWRSFAAVWSADVLAFFAIYAWKMGWLSQTNKLEDS